MVLQTQASEADESGYFQQWYQKNKKKLSKRRKQKYQSDPEYRDRQLQASKDWRSRNPDYRNRKKDDQPKRFTIGEAATQIGSCPQTIRALEAKGMIPKANKGIGHRMYSEAQVALMHDLILYLQTVHYRNRSKPKLAALVKNLKTNWRA